MAIAVGIVGVVFAAFVVWLAVRLANRRERWAAQTAVGLIAASIVLYPLTMGPTAWLYYKLGKPDWAWRGIVTIYQPIVKLEQKGPGWIGDVMVSYRRWWIGH